MRRLIPEDEVESELARFVAAEAADLADIAAIRGAAEFAARIPRQRWAVVTSSSHAVAEARLRQTCFPLPGALVTAEDVLHGKPDPEPWLKAAATLGFEPRSCLVFEDANSGIRAARAAGMPVIGVRWSREKLECEYQIGDFDDVSLAIDDRLRVTVPDLP
jgi:sugar-phosphatase